MGVPVISTEFEVTCRTIGQLSPRGRSAENGKTDNGADRIVMARDFLRDNSVVRFVVVSSVGLSCRQLYSSSKKWHKDKLRLEARAREKDHRVAMSEK